jgi:hypothetical protein
VIEDISLTMWVDDRTWQGLHSGVRSARVRVPKDVSRGALPQLHVTRDHKEHHWAEWPHASCNTEHAPAAAGPSVAASTAKSPTPFRPQQHDSPNGQPRTGYFLVAHTRCQQWGFMWRKGSRSVPENTPFCTSHRLPRPCDDESHRVEPPEMHVRTRLAQHQESTHAHQPKDCVTQAEFSQTHHVRYPSHFFARPQASFARDS